MEDTLRDLQVVRAAHRRALAETRAVAIDPAPATAKPLPTALPPMLGERQRLMQLLAVDIERVSGIEMTGVIEAKLGRVLASVDVGELAAWVGRLHLLAADHPEWLSLIESLTVHETFFHRDRSQLELLRGILRRVIAAAAAEGRHSLRLWSAGCATGEEAYTLAILALLALREAGFAVDARDGGIVCRPPWQIDVLGTDISRLVLAQAKADVYSTEGLSAFRDLPPELRHFFPILRGGGGASESERGGDSERRGVLEMVRQHVRFRHFNLMDGAPPDTGFDVVLCRNVLIYLTLAARKQVQSLFKVALRRGGCLLLGPTDAIAEPAAYDACWGTGAVAYALKPPR